MIIRNFFTDEDKHVYRALIEQTYGEVQEKYEKLFKLDVYPGLIIDFTYNAMQPQQSLVWAGTNLEVFDKENLPQVRSIIVDEIVVQVVPIYIYLKELGFERLLDQLQYQYLFKEFLRSYIIYQLIKAHSLKYDYDRFFGANANKTQREILKPLIEEEQNLRYYKDLQNFYNEKEADNHIGGLFTALNFKLIDYLEAYKTIKGMAKNTAIMNIVWEIISLAREKFPSE